MRVVFDHRDEEAKNITTFFFRPDKPLRYTAGQYVELTLPHDQPDQRGIKRWFTLSSSPTDELLSITTKFSDPGSSFKRALSKLTIGHKLTISDPLGDFVLPKLVQTPLIFVAGGIGITPFHSILTWLTSTKERRQIRMIYGVPNEDEIIFQETFHRASLHTTIVVNKPSAAWGGERGVLTPELILAIGQPTSDALIYIAGPEPMVETLEKALIQKGINKNQLVLDFFPNYSDR